MVAPLAAIGGAAAAFGAAAVAVGTAPVTLAVGAAVVVDQGVAYGRDVIFGGNHQSLLGYVAMGGDDNRTPLGNMWDAKVALPMERNIAEREAEIDAAQQYQASRERLESAFPGAGEARDIGNPFALEQ